MPVKLLTISIPTYSRPRELAICLTRLSEAASKIGDDDRNLLDIIIFDNSADCHSERIVKLHDGVLTVKYKKNERNIGSDRNIAQSYLSGEAKYILVLGDDDYVERDFFCTLIPLLKGSDAAVVSLNCYGLTRHHNESRPLSFPKVIHFDVPRDFLLFRNIHIGFISGIIIRRELLSSSGIERSVGTNLVQVHAVCEALAASGKSVFVNRYLIGSTRNNTGGYNPVKIFVVRFFEILSENNFFGMDSGQLRALKFRLLMTFYCRSFAQHQRGQDQGLQSRDLDDLDKMFLDTLLYKIFIRRLLAKKSILSFYVLTFIYVVSNILIYPEKFFIFTRHVRYGVRSIFIKNH